MAAQVVKKLPEGNDWIYELKFDGYRALIIKVDQRVELRPEYSCGEAKETPRWHPVQRAQKRPALRRAWQTLLW